MSWRPLQQGIDEFFFAPGPIIQLAVFRVLFGLIVIESALLMLPEISVWLQPDSAVTVQSAQSLFGVRVFSIWDFFPDSRSISYVVLLVLAVAAACLVLGLKTRFAAFIVYLCLLSVYHRNPLILHSGDTYMRLQALWLCFSECGSALSIEHCWQQKKNAPFDVIASLWPLRVVQMQFCFVYVSAFFSKIQCNRWLDGTALYYTSHLREFERLPVPFLFDNLMACKLLTWSSLAIEFALFSLIWYRPLRYPVLIAALVFHLFIEWCMNVPLFEWLMIVSLVLFIDANDLSRLLNRWKPRKA
jgi:uncharacterized membrane protein YphA (DoxX/SURF4 family)